MISLSKYAPKHSVGQKCCSCHTQNHRKSGKVSDDKTSENSGVSFELPVVRKDLLNPHILHPNSNRCITDWFQEICGKIMVQKRGNIAANIQ